VVPRKKLQVVVIGGGVIGLFAAYYLAVRNHEVTVIDHGPLNKSTSVYSAGMIVPSFSSSPIGLKDVLPTYLGRAGPVCIPLRSLLTNGGWLMSALSSNRLHAANALMTLGKKSLGLYEEFFVRESPEVDIKRGILGLYRERRLAEKAANQFRGKFIDETGLNSLGFAEICGGVLFENEMALDPMKLIDYLTNKLSEMGVRILIGKARNFDGAIPTIRSVLCGNDRYAADTFVLAAGIWSRDLCERLGYRPPILPARGLTRIYETRGVELVGFPALLEDYGVALVQHNPHRLRVTCFFDLEGLDPSISRSRKRWLDGVLMRHLKNWRDITLVHEGVGYRPCAPDQLPIIGRVPKYENMYVATGHCRLGITLAPATAYAIVRMIEGTAIDFPVGPYEPSRF